MDANAPIPAAVSTKHRRNLILLASAAAIPFVLSLVAHLGAPQAQQPEPGITRPALVFDQYMVDRGPIGAEPNAFAHFVFHNRGNETVRITELEPSCGCLTSEFKNKKMEYAPGESGEFFLTVRTTRETPGQKDYYVKVHYDDPQPREIDVTFRFVLPEHQVRIDPAALIFYQNGLQATTQHVVVTDNRPKPLEVRDVTTTSDLVTAKIDRIEDDPEGPRRTHILVTAAKEIPAGKPFRAVVSMLTDDEKYTELQVPLMIQRTGGMAPLARGKELKVIPEVISLSPSREKPAEAEVVVTDHHSAAIDVKDVRSSSPAVRAQLSPKAETDANGHKQWRIAVTAMGDLPPGNFRSVITIRTSDPERPELQVPVQVHIADPLAAGKSKSTAPAKPSAN
jgi:hypothetical protein